MTRRIVVRPKAQADLQEIWAYTQRTWDQAQADTYIRELEGAILRIADQPELGSDRSYIQDGLRKVTARSHAIYYFHNAQVLRVSRILHARRDAEREL